MANSEKWKVCPVLRLNENDSHNHYHSFRLKVYNFGSRFFWHNVVLFMWKLSPLYHFTITIITLIFTKKPLYKSKNYTKKGLKFEFCPKLSMNSRVIRFGHQPSARTSSGQYTAGMATYARVTSTSNVSFPCAWDFGGANPGPCVDIIVENFGK